MKVLVACEYSGVVRDAFIAKGHDAMSCDLLPTDRPGPHYQGSVFDVIDACWDMMIAHPPCTHLAVSGAGSFAEKRLDGRQAFGISFFMRLIKSDIPKIAVENPICIMSSLFRKPDQIINPWEFGHETTKATCLWLKGLPPLFPTSIVSKGERQYYASGKSSPMWHAKTGGGMWKGTIENISRDRKRNGKSMGLVHRKMEEGKMIYTFINEFDGIVTTYYWKEGRIFICRNGETLVDSNPLPQSER